MHRAIALLGLVAVLVWPGISLAQETITVTETFRLPALGGTIDRRFMCPIGYQVSKVEVTYLGARPADASTKAVDVNGNEIAWGLQAFSTVHGGVRFRATNRSAADEEGVLTLVCTLRLFSSIVSQATIPPNATGSVAGFCPSGQVPVGQTSNADGVDLATRFVVFLHGTPPNVTLMDDLPDGTHAAPSGIGRGVANNTSAPLILYAQTSCAVLADAQTIIHSAPTTQGDRFSIWAPVPDGRSYVLDSFVGGLYGNVTLSDFWGTNGTVAAQLPHSGALNIAYETRAREIHGIDQRLDPFARKASARAVIGLLTVPASSAPPAPTVVTVVEFHHAGLDHYFITAIAKEISDLDSGVHAGWQRTGQTFKAYGVGSSGSTGRRPVCRSYGNPARGLDSHFYSASMQECLATLENFNGAWLLEASEVFQLELPDTITGACPVSRVAIHRLWNQRADSNHRYVKSIALRDQMTGLGWLAEGYGPNAVVLCALP